jgi:GT2 family glycosyltransferase
MRNADLEDSMRGNLALAHDIALLFRVILGRAADPEGMRHYAAEARSGQSLRRIARNICSSSEYRARYPAGVWWKHACANAGEPDTKPRPLQSRASYLCELVARPSVRRRFSLPPVGMEHYELWREMLARSEAERPAQALPEPATPEPAPVAVAVVVFVSAPMVPHLEEMRKSIGSTFGNHTDILLLLPPELEPLAAAQLDARIGSEPSIGVLGTHDQAEKLARLGADFALLLSDRYVVDPGVATDLASAQLANASIVSFDQDRVQDGVATAPMLGGCWDGELSQTALPQSFFAVRSGLLRELRLCLPADPVIAEWHLIARAAAAVPTTAIAHVPRVRRHRLCQAADAPVPDKREMIDEVRGRLDAAGRRYEAVVAGEAPGCVRLIHALPTPPPLVSIIIPTRNRASLLRTCLAGLMERTDYAALEILIVDNGSDEPDALRLLEAVGRDPRVKVLRQPGVFNWARFNNLAADIARGDVLLFLNNDIDVIDGDWLEEIASQALRPEIGAVGAKLLNADSTVQHAGIAMNETGDAYHAWRGAADTDHGYMLRLAAVGSVSAVTGACLATRKQVWRRVHGFDERMPVTYSDIDFCFRVRAAGLRVIYTPYAKLFHYEGSTRGSDARPEEWARLAREAAIFKETWGEWSREEPWLGPNIDADGPAPKLVPVPVDRLDRIVVARPPAPPRSPPG